MTGECTQILLLGVTPLTHSLHSIHHSAQGEPSGALRWRCRSVTRTLYTLKMSLSHVVCQWRAYTCPLHTLLTMYSLCADTRPFNAGHVYYRITNKSDELTGIKSTVFTTNTLPGSLLRKLWWPLGQLWASTSKIDEQLRLRVQSFTMKINSCLYLSSNVQKQNRQAKHLPGSRNLE